MSPETTPSGPDVVARHGRVGATPAAEKLLELAQVKKQWPKSPTPLFEAVDVALRQGEFMWLTGSNGVGKTTLLRVAAGLLRADAGEVRAGRLDPHRDRRDFQRRIGFLSATSAGLYARMTVGQHLDYWARLALLPRSRRAERILSMSSAFGLEGLLKRRVDRLSTGQRKRVRLAGAFVHSPGVVLLDEPGNSLDADGRRMLLTAIGVLRGEGGAALWCAPSGESRPPQVDARYELEAGSLVRR